MKPHRFVQARGPRAATEVPIRKLAKPSVFPADENISATTTARNIYLTTEAKFATNSIDSGAYFISARGQFGIKVQAMNEASRRATA